MTKIIAGWGITNNSSFNVFSISSDFVVGGYNATSIDDCESYEIQWNHFNDDDEIITSEDIDDDNIRSYIETSEGMYLFLDECLRTDLGLM